MRIVKMARKGAAIVGAVAVLAGLLVAPGPMSGTALADHQHKLATPNGNEVILPCEPEHIGDATPGQSHKAVADRHRPGVLHPMHNMLHKGPGAPSDETNITPGDEDPVNILLTGERCYE